MKRGNLIWISVLILCLLLPVNQAEAARYGSIQIHKIDEPVYLYHVADENAILTEAFSGAPVKELSSQSQAVKNTGILWQYAKEQGIEGQLLTPDSKGTAKAEQLEMGMYLIGSAIEPEEFDPFLVSIPTWINGEIIYDVEADPKQEEEPTVPSTEPSGPSEPVPSTEPNPEIPQTGVNVWPKYILLILGTAVTLLGLYEVIRGRKGKA